MDKVYVMMVDDRHSDPEPTVYASSFEAINDAASWARDHASDPDDIDESPIGGWLYHATYSSESDSVWVLEKPVIGTGGP